MKSKVSEKRNINVKRDSFVFYRSFFEAISEAPDDVRLHTYEAIVLYGLDGEIPDLQGWAKSIFMMAKPQIDANTKRYVNGCSGGAPVGNENARKTTKKQPKNNQKQPNENDNDNDNVNDNDNEKEKENENNNVPLQGVKGEIDLSFLDDYSLIFQDAIKKWMKYKSEKYNDRMTQQQIQESVKFLTKYDDATAADIVSRCIASSYRGLTAPTHQKKESIGIVQTENDEKKYVESINTGF